MPNSQASGSDSRAGGLQALVERHGMKVLRCTYANTLLLPVALARFRLWEPLTRQPAAAAWSRWQRWLDRLLYAPLELEARWLGPGMNLPVGPIDDSDRGEDGGPVTDKFPALSVFFPAFNDAPSLRQLVAKTFAVLERHVEDYEVIVVNDGSQDDTAKMLAEAARQIRSQTAGGDASAGIWDTGWRCAAGWKPRARSSFSIPMATASTTWMNCRELLSLHGARGGAGERL